MCMSVISAEPVGTQKTVEDFALTKSSNELNRKIIKRFARRLLPVISYWRAESGKSLKDGYTKANSVQSVKPTSTIIIYFHKQATLFYFLYKHKQTNLSLNEGKQP